MMTEYNALNERLKKQYEDTLLHENYRESKTAEKVWKALNQFEHFTGKKEFISFNAEQAKGFKRWLAKQENSKGELLSVSTVRSTLKNLRDFFSWLAIHPRYMRKVDGRAVGYLRLSNNAERAGRATRALPVPSIEEVRTLLESMPHHTETEKRDRAIVAFMALTGVRDAALISLKLKDIDRKKGEVWQDPKHVDTKSRKAISTFFMPFDPIWQEMVDEWLDYVEQELQFLPTDPLFPKTYVEPCSEKLSFVAQGLSRYHWSNAAPIRDILKKGFVAAGLPYYNPHSFRKMLIVWAMEHCTQIEFKAISQNIGHEHALVTYNSYGTLNDHKREAVIRSIGSGSSELSNIAHAQLMAEVQRRMQD